MHGKYSATGSFIYDIECYPNVFLFGARHDETGKERYWEISHRKNEALAIARFISNLRRMSGVRMVGYNNVGYDYPVTHLLYTALTNIPSADVITHELYEQSSKIINDNSPMSRWVHRIKPYEVVVPQLDLMLVNHFDNPARRTSLKSINFAMRQENIIELPYKPGSILESDQIDQLLFYLRVGDIGGTQEFYRKCSQQIAFREELSNRFNMDMMNYSNSKIGSTFFIKRLEQRLGKDACYYKEYGKSQRKIRQTKRESIKIADVILPIVDIPHSRFKALVAWLKQQEITETKKVFTEIPFEKVESLKKYYDPAKKNGKLKNLNIMLDGIKFVFGTGGIHASVKKRSFFSRNGMRILDIDAKSYYPFLSISQRIYPEHLTSAFCDINLELFNERIVHASGTTLNKAIKEALNATFGNSNSEFSPIYDPQYTMAITVNGQLLLCMLYAWLRRIESVELVQMNTDGLTIYYHQDDENEILALNQKWQDLTKIMLETVSYDQMHVRDVNNYIAVDTKGKVKRKGKYEYDLAKLELWNKNFNALVVPRAVEQYFLNKVPLREFIINHADTYDFFLCTKKGKTASMVTVDVLDNQTEQQIISRYFVCKPEFGDYLYKIMSPTEKNPQGNWIAVNKGFYAKICNTSTHINREEIDYEFYIKEAEKLINFEGEDYDGDY